MLVCRWFEIGLIITLSHANEDWDDIEAHSPSLVGSSIKSHLSAREMPSNPNISISSNQDETLRPSRR
jgi:hypothetical protein